jgi:hypothetical protein
MEDFQNISRMLPKMADVEVQNSWTQRPSAVGIPARQHADFLGESNYTIASSSRHNEAFIS